MTDMKAWITAYLLSLFILLAVVGGVEYTLRAQKQKPQVTDSMQLWAVQRERANNFSAQALVFIGASRTLYGIDLKYVKDNLHGYRPVMLAVNGHYPLAMLEALAKDMSFKGTVIVDVDARGLAKYNHNMQKDYVKYYESHWGPALSWHRRILNIWQEHAVVARHDFSLVNLLMRWVTNSQVPFSNSETDRDRNSRLYFELVDAKALADNFAIGLEADLRANPPPPADLWLADLSDVKAWVQEIRQRGGDVIFYTPPVAARQYWLAEKAYPRKLYWDRFVAEAGVKSVLAEDINGMQKIVLPDESHMDASQKAHYTKLLVDALIDLGYLHR